MEEYRTPDERAARALERIASELANVVKILAMAVGLAIGQLLSHVLIK